VERKYAYGSSQDLSPQELFLCVLADTFMEPMGISDAAAVFAIILGQPIIPTRTKVNGATPGTSIASKYLSQLPQTKSPIKLPMLTGKNVFSLRLTFTHNIGRWVGRSIPIVGWVILAADAAQISYKAVSRYNTLVSAEDRLS
jgi:hypothetical protein